MWDLVFADTITIYIYTWFSFHLWRLISSMASCYTSVFIAIIRANLLSLNTELTEKACQSITLFMSLFISFLFWPSAGRCPIPLKNRDVVTLRSWQVTDDEYIMVNFSVKHPVRHLLHPLKIHSNYCLYTYCLYSSLTPLCPVVCALIYCF